jgi:hypothetical protein
VDAQKRRLFGNSDFKGAQELDTSISTKLEMDNGIKKEEKNGTATMGGATGSPPSPKSCQASTVIKSEEMHVDSRK